MKYLVTGASGFIGSHLAKRLAKTGGTVLGWGKKGVAAAVECQAVDVAEAHAVREAVNRFMPDVIFHLAAQSFPKRAWEEPKRTLETNIIGTLNMLDAVAGMKQPCRLLIAGSSAQYQASSERIRETDAQDPANPYALSKFCADRLAVSYAEKYALDIVRFFPFHVIGPGKRGDVASDLAQKIIDASRNNLPSIPVGNIDITRDFLDIEDALDALLLLAEQGQAGDAYNICSGVGYPIARMLECYRRLSGQNIACIPDPTLVRKNEPPAMVGDPSKLMRLGWKPTLPIEDTLERIYRAVTLADGV